MAVETLETCPACGESRRIRVSGAWGLCDKCHGVALAILNSGSMRRQPLRAVFDGETFRRVAAYLTSRRET